MKENNDSLAMELLIYSKEQNKKLDNANKKLFVIWIITFIFLIGVVCYTIYLLNDISTITTSEQTIEGVETIDSSNIVNGDMYGDN